MVLQCRFSERTLKPKNLLLGFGSGKSGRSIDVMPAKVYTDFESSRLPLDDSYCSSLIRTNVCHPKPTRVFCAAVLGEARESLGC